MQLTQLGDAFAAFREWTTTNAPWIGAALIAAWFLRYYLKFRGNESGVDPVSASFRGVQLEARLFARRVSTLAMFVGGTAVVAVTILVNAVPALVTGDVATWGAVTTLAVSVYQLVGERLSDGFAVQLIAGVTIGIWVVGLLVDRLRDSEVAD